MRAAAAPRLGGRQVLAMLLGFFGVVMAVNGIFVWLALGSFTGVEAPRAYRSGLHYNQELAQAAAQAALGWRLEIEASGRAGQVALQVGVRDATGLPVDGLELAAVWRRPTQAAWDRTSRLRPAGPGRYEATARLPAAGQWDLQVTATHPDKGSYRVDRRLMLR